MRTKQKMSGMMMIVNRKLKVTILWTKIMYRNEMKTCQIIFVQIEKYSLPISTILIIIGIGHVLNTENITAIIRCV